MNPDKLTKITKQHAERMYNIILDNLQKQREAHAKKTKK